MSDQQNAEHDDEDRVCANVQYILEDAPFKRAEFARAVCFKTERYQNWVSSIHNYRG